MGEQVHDMCGGTAFVVCYRAPCRSNVFGFQEIKWIEVTPGYLNHSLFMAHNVCRTSLVYGLLGAGSVARKVRRDTMFDPLTTSAVVRELSGP